MTAVSPWPHRLAVTLAVITFPLIWVGGLVTTYDAGMAVPDWPGTYGYNLFLYPWQTWVAGPWDLFIEHGHRMLGALAGLLAIALVVSAWVTHSPAKIRWSAAALLALVILQGVLGGLRVVLDARVLALVHGCTGPLFFAATAVVALLTSQQSSTKQLEAGSSLPASAWALFAATLLQLIAGAHVRHLPYLGTNRLFQAAVVFHLLLAVAVVMAAVRCVNAAAHAEPASGVARWTLLISLLIGVQLALGVATWVVKYNWPVWFEQFYFAAAHVVQAKSLPQALLVTAHVANGSLILATSAMLIAKVYSLGPQNSATPASRLELAA